VYSKLRRHELSGGAHARRLNKRTLQRHPLRGAGEKKVDGEAGLEPGDVLVGWVVSITERVQKVLRARDWKA